MRPTSLIPIAAGLALTLGACNTGPGVDTYTPARSPQGVEIRIRMRGGETSGELLEVRDSGVVVSQRSIVLVPFELIEEFRLTQERSAYPGGPPSAEVRERLRLLSRFPSGLSADHLARILEARGQRELEVYRPPADRESIDEATFIAAARAATARFRDLNVARESGYRPIGGELPSLGEHWVHGQRALADTLDPAAPAILVYVRVAGEAVLAGVAYTSLLAPGETPPNFPHGRPHAWHEHNGAVDEEVLPAAHHAAQTVTATDSRLRIAVMHAWIWLPNLAGLWESEHWGLPSVRLGLAPDAGTGIEARALSLATTPEYYLQAIIRTADIGAEDASRVEAILDAHAQRARRAAARFPTADEERGAALAGIWRSFWMEAMAAVRPETADRMRGLRDLLTH